MIAKVHFGRWATLACLAVLSSTIGFSAMQPQDAETLFKNAIEDQQQGNVGDAAKIYSQLIEDEKTSANIVAEALSRVLSCSDQKSHLVELRKVVLGGQGC